MSTRHAAWHQALVFALTGQRRPELGAQEFPDLDRVLADLRPAQPDRPFDPSPEPLGTRIYPVPADLSGGIGPAQFSATLTELRRRLRTDAQPVVVADRPLDRDERRLTADVPPHHG